MPRKKKQPPQNEPAAEATSEVQTPAPAKKALRVKPDWMTKDQVKAWQKFNRDSREIEAQWRRIIY
jgi:hypothetical protein